MRNLSFVRIYVFIMYYQQKDVRYVCTLILTILSVKLVCGLFHIAKSWFCFRRNKTSKSTHIKFVIAVSVQLETSAGWARERPVFCWSHSKCASQIFFDCLLENTWCISLPLGERCHPGAMICNDKPFGRKSENIFHSKKGLHAVS